MHAQRSSQPALCMAGVTPGTCRQEVPTLLTALLTLRRVAIHHHLVSSCRASSMHHRVVDLSRGVLRTC